MSEKTIVTAVAGDSYFRMAVALMLSIENAGTPKSIKKRIFCYDTDISKYHLPECIEVVTVSHNTTNDKFANRRIKSDCLVHQSVKNSDVIFLDADCIVYDNIFPHLFDLLRKYSVLTIIKALSENVPTRQRNRIKNGVLINEEFFICKAARHLYSSIANIHTNGGFYGRADDEVGHKFAKLFHETLLNRPFFIFEENESFFTMEPYLSYAYQVATEYALNNQIPIINTKEKCIYSTDVNNQINHGDNGILHAVTPTGQILHQLSIVHYVKKDVNYINIVNKMLEEHAIMTYD